MKLKNLYLICFAFITCLAWLKTNRKNQLLTKIFNACKYGQEKVNVPSFGIVNWWAKRFGDKMKYVLLWPSKEFIPFNELAAGQEEFIKLNCPVNNCFMTTNKTYFDDIRKFDFIAFMGREVFIGNLPLLRAIHQRYIYFNMESSPYYPLEEEFFNGYFNWTSTYRLDSDIPMPYIQIRDKNGNVVGPKVNMTWIPEEPVDMEALPNGLISRKYQAAAIFYSNCRSLSVREEVIEDIQKELKRYGLQIDVFGACGSYHCPRKKQHVCNEMLKKYYFFYLSFENSFDIDYVTEKLLTAVQNYVVPIVYGGANYSRFLPPGSYLDATEMTPMKLANTMALLMGSREKYLQFFWWTKYYTYHNPIDTDNICNICATMNNKTKLEVHKVYKDFRRWWNIITYV